MHKLSTLLFGGLLSVSTHAWELVSNSDGVEAFTMKSNETGFNKVRVVSTFPASLETLVAVNTDAANLSDWMETFEQVDVLSKTNWHDYVLHARYGFPFPYDDRESITHTTFHRSNEQIVLSFKSVESEIAPYKDTVRMPFVEGSWTFIPKSPTETEVIYETHVVPGGNSPAWLVNMVSVDVPVKTIHNLKNYLKTYQAAAVAITDIPAI